METKLAFSQVSGEISGKMAQDPATDRLGKLYEQRAQIAARIKQLEARTRARSRKEDTRRKIIAGALALEHASRDEAFGRTLHDLIARFVTRPHDRALFGLPPARGEPQAGPAFSSSAGG